MGNLCTTSHVNRAALLLLIYGLFIYSPFSHCLRKPIPIFRSVLPSTGKLRNYQYKVLGLGLFWLSINNEKDAKFYKRSSLLMTLSTYKRTWKLIIFTSTFSTYVCMIIIMIRLCLYETTKRQGCLPIRKVWLVWIDTLWKRKYGLDLFSLSLCPMKISFLGGESMSIYFRLVEYPSYIFFNSFVFRYKLGNRRPIFDTICDWNG